jgi:hypothetical protein
MDVYLQAQQLSEWLLFNANSSAILQLYHYNFQWDEDEVRFVLDQYANLDFYSASSLKQQSVDRHVAPIGHIVLIPSQPVLALSPYCCVLSGATTNTNFTVFGVTRSGVWKNYALTITSTMRFSAKLKL